jgi:hypothetical protein
MNTPVGSLEFVVITLLCAVLFSGTIIGLFLRMRKR